MTLSHKKNIICENFFPWQEKFSCDRKLLPVEMFPVTEYCSCDKKFFFSDREFHSVTENFFLWKEVFLLWQRISSYNRKFLPETVNFFLWQEISSCELSKKSRTFVVILRYDEKSRSFVAILYQIHSRCFKRNYLLEN